MTGDSRPIAEERRRPRALLREPGRRRARSSIPLSRLVRIGGYPGLVDGNPGQVLTQVLGVIVTILWTAIGSLILLKVIDWAIGLRVPKDVERDGLDLALHGETVH